MELIFQKSVPYNLSKGKQCDKAQNKNQREKQEFGVSAVYFTCSNLIALIQLMTLLLQTVVTSCLHTKEKVSDILWANAMENINKDAN